jgi:hypothetical protein
MAAKLGSTDVSFRLGAGEVAAVYLGSQEVWSAVSVPGKPPTLNLFLFSDATWIAQIGVPEDGGSQITDYRIYVNGILRDSNTFEDPELISERQVDGSLFPGDSITASAVNAIGEGPQSDPFVIV